MRTTVDLPDELLKQARSRAAEERSTLTALIADGLRLRLATSAHPTPEQRLGAIQRGRSAFSGTFPAGYLERLRDEWPD